MRIGDCIADVFSSDLDRYCAVFFFKQQTAYEMRISDWSSDVCSSDLSDSSSTLAGRRSVKSWITIAGSSSPSAPGARVWPSVVGVSSRSEERRVGKECVSPGRSRWSSSPYKMTCDRQPFDERRMKKGSVGYWMSSVGSG